MKKLCWIILFFFLNQIASAGTYYTRQGGSASWGESAGECGHVTDGPTNPCSLFTSFNAVAPGDTVKMQDDGGDFSWNGAGMLGGYDGSGDPTMASGTTGNWITWEPETGDNPRLNYSGGHSERQYMVN